MTGLADLPMYFQKLQEETLPFLGFDDPSIARIVAARLLIERLGESDVNYWWDSQVLTEFGRARLEETVPRTTTTAQIDLAMKVGRKVEDDVIADEAVTLFDLGPGTEASISRAMESIENEDKLSILYSCEAVLNERGWSDELVPEQEFEETDSGNPIEMGTVSAAALMEDDLLDDVVSQLILGYGHSTKDDLHIPYFRVKS